MSDHKLVPVEPTPGMLEAGKYALDAGCHASGIYADMLAAAPAVQGEPEALQAECEKLRKDAERYRWLCDGNGYFLEHEMLCGFENEKAQADAAIDAAMQETNHDNQ